MSKDEMIGWHHQLNGHEYEQALGVGDGHGSKDLDMTERLKNKTLIPEVIDISPGNLDCSFCFTQPDISHDIFCI